MVFIYLLSLLESFAQYVLKEHIQGVLTTCGQNRTHVYMNVFNHKDLGNHLLQ